MYVKQDEICIQFRDINFNHSFLCTFFKNIYKFYYGKVRILTDLAIIRSQYVLQYVVTKIMTTNLKFHDISTSWSSNKSSSNITVILVHGSNIPWVFIVVNDLDFMKKMFLSIEIKGSFSFCYGAYVLKISGW